MTWPKIELNNPIAQIIASLAMLAFALGTCHKAIAAVSKFLIDQNKRRLPPAPPKMQPAKSASPVTIPMDTELPTFASCRPSGMSIQALSLGCVGIMVFEAFSSAPVTRAAMVTSVLAVVGLFFSAFTYGSIWILFYLYGTMLTLHARSTQLAVDAALILPRAINKAAERNDTPDKDAQQKRCTSQP